MSDAIQVEPDEADVTRLAIKQRDEARAVLAVTASERNDLAKTLDALKARHAEVLGWFASNGSGHYARVSGTVLAREYVKAGMPVPDELSHLAGQ
jgi:hypothetical protein